MTPTANILNAYVSLLILQYQQGNAQNQVYLFASALLQNQLFGQFADKFSLSGATGAILDILASYRGLARQIYGYSIYTHVFQLPSQSDSFLGTAYGFATAAMSPASITWYWDEVSGLGQSTTTLRDNDMLRALEILCALQGSPMGVGEIDAVLYQCIPTAQLNDNLDMTIQYHDTVADVDVLFSICTALQLLPKPAGVTVTYGVS